MNTIKDSPFGRILKLTSGPHAGLFVIKEGIVATVLIVLSGVPPEDETEVDTFGGNCFDVPSVFDFWECEILNGDLTCNNGYLSEK